MARRSATNVARPAAASRGPLNFLPREWARIGALYGVVAVLHGLGWGLYLHCAASYPALVGLGLVAYLFGLRHAFDADHIAAIDDTVATCSARASGHWVSASFSLSLVRMLAVLGLVSGHERLDRRPQGI
jgi:high-affinity nickel-transport protein